MNTNVINENGIKIAIVSSEELIIKDVQSALDFIATIYYDTGCTRIIINKEVVCEEFFDLKTRIAGEILQKFINYDTKVAIVGDYSEYTSNSLKAFIYESNNGRDIYFLSDEKEAILKLSKA